MDNALKIVVIEKSGWQRDYRSTRNIVHIGSGSHNDIVLDRPSDIPIAPQHLQLIATDAGYRLINLAETPITLLGKTPRTLAPHGVDMMTEGEKIQLGSYTLVPGGDMCTVSTGNVSTSAAGVIGIHIHLSHTVLDTQKPIEGTITVRNLGEQPGAQFFLELQGIPPTCYDIGPGPILYPNAAKEVPLRLHHPHGPDLHSGQHRLQVIATAPEAYPTQRVVATEQITVLPLYQYTVEVVVTTKD